MKPQGNVPVHSTGNAELPVIDWGLCIKLANYKEEVAEELLTLVIEQLPLDLGDIKQAYEKNNYSDLLRYTHKLHGALCYSGIPRLKKVVATLESTLKQKTFDEKTIAKMMADIEAEAAKVLTSQLPV